MNTEALFDDFPINVMKDGEYTFLVSASDNHTAHDKAHRVRSLLQMNKKATLSVAVCFYLGSDVDAGGALATSWGRLSHSFVAYYDGNRRIVAGQQSYNGGTDWRQQTNPSGDCAAVALTSLWGGAHDGHGHHSAPLVWVLQGHGASAPYSSKAIVVHHGRIHKCLVAVDGTVNPSGWAKATVSSVGTSLSGLQLAILAGCETGQRDTPGGVDTMAGLMRNKGAANTIAFNRTVTKIMANYWLKDFFAALFRYYPSAIQIDSDTIETVAKESQKRTIDHFSGAQAHWSAGDLSPFLVLNGHRVEFGAD